MFHHVQILLLLTATAYSSSQHYVTSGKGDKTKEETIKEGSHGVIRCHGNHQSQSPINWKMIVSPTRILHIGGSHNSSSMSHYNILKNGDLVIVPVRMADSGIYICYSEKTNKVFRKVNVRIDEVSTSTSHVKQEPSYKYKAVSDKTIMFLVVIGVVVFLIGVDFCCYYVQRCGLINCLCVHCIEPQRKRREAEKQNKKNPQKHFKK